MLFLDDNGAGDAAAQLVFWPEYLPESGLAEYVTNPVSGLALPAVPVDASGVPLACCEPDTAEVHFAFEVTDSRSRLVDVTDAAVEWIGARSRGACLGLPMGAIGGAHAVTPDGRELIASLLRGEGEPVYAVNYAYHVRTHDQLWYAARLERAWESRVLCASLWPCAPPPSETVTGWARLDDPRRPGPPAAYPTPEMFVRAAYEAWVRLGGPTVHVRKKELAFALGLSYRQWRRLEKLWLPCYPPPSPELHIPPPRLS